MASVNKAVIVGRLGQDPETRYMPSGGAVTNLSVATDSQWTDKQTKEKQKRTEWHRVTIYGRLAEIAAEYLKKGSLVYLEGELQTRKWTDKAGIERHTTEINAREMQMLDRKEADLQSRPAAARVPGSDDDFGDDPDKIGF